MSNIKTALVSVWDKTGIVDLANFLALQEWIRTQVNAHTLS